MSISIPPFQYEVIISHGPGCNDGSVAAWCFWRLLPREYRDILALEGGFYAKPTNEEPQNYTGSFIHPNSCEGALKLQERFPVVFAFSQPNQDIPLQLIKDRKVLILDLDLGDNLPRIAQAATSLTIVDHHISTSMTLGKHAQVIFNELGTRVILYIDTNTSQSAASLAWKLTHLASIPPLVEIVRIGDTWQWQDQPELQARLVLKALYVRRAFRSFPDIEATYLHWNENFEAHVMKGRALCEYETNIINQIAKASDIGYIETTDGHIYCVAYAQCNVLHSEVGAVIRKYASLRTPQPIDFCATWKYVSFKGLVSVSLRDASNSLNLAEIARKVKDTGEVGGGHIKAAAFSFYGIENFHKYIQRARPEVIKPVTDPTST